MIMVIWTLSSVGAAIGQVEEQFDWMEDVPTGCQCTKVGVLKSTIADYDQDYQTQITVYWPLFMLVNDGYNKGLVDTDRVGNHSLRYNCHGNTFYGSMGWVNDPQPYWGTSVGCWEPDPQGTLYTDNHAIYSDGDHSCKVQDANGFPCVGKWGDGPVIKNSHKLCSDPAAYASNANRKGRKLQ